MIIGGGLPSLVNLTFMPVSIAWASLMATGKGTSLKSVRGPPLFLGNMKGLLGGLPTCMTLLQSVGRSEVQWLMQWW